MNDPKRCDLCGGALQQAGVLGGRCPRCLVELGLDLPSGLGNTRSVRTAQEEIGVSAVLGDYTVRRLIGEGGMGAVYEAEQKQPRRTVALKIVNAGMTRQKSLRRFEQEAEALGRLQHPNIAQIYEAGTADTGFGPQPYLAMEFIRGRALVDYARERKLNVQERLELIAKVADAVHHAHQRGLIHRDLKPANILVDESGQPKILDFGISRIQDSEADSSPQTNAGELLGTLGYMSPEQLSGDPLEIDTRTDVYALGVVLYELLAGQPPYDTTLKLHDAIRAIREEGPARLGLVNRAYRGDIETIASTALEKDKTRRYSSAAELAADIRRHLRDEPIIARPPSASYHLQKFARRHRAIVVGVAAVFSVLVAGVVVSARQADRARSAEQTAVVERDRAQQAELTARLERDNATSAEETARTQRDLALSAQEQATTAEGQARQDRDRFLWQSLARESLRASAVRDDDRAALLARQAMLFHARTPKQAMSLVEEALQKATRTDPWSHLLLKHTQTVYFVAFSRDGLLACACGDKIVRVWDRRHPDTAPLLLEGHGSGVESVAFSPDGAYLASGSRDKTVRLWDLRNPAATPVVLDARGEVYTVLFSPDSARLASAGTGNVRVWDLRNLGANPIVFGDDGTSTSVAFSPDGTRLASGGFGLELWDLRNPGARPLQLRDPKSTGNGITSAIVFSPDGARLISGENPGVYLWDLSNPSKPPVEFRDSRTGGGVTTLALSPDGAQLAAGSDKIRMWDLPRPDAAPRFLEGHQRRVLSVAFSPDGTHLASGSSDETLRVWDLRDARVPLLLSPASAPSTPRAPRSPYSTPGLGGPLSPTRSPAFPGVMFSPDGTRLVSGGDDPDVRVWDLRNPNIPSLLLHGHQDAVLSVAFSPDGTRIASGGSATVPLPPGSLFSVEGARLAFGGSGSVRVWNIHNPKAPPLLLQGHQDAILTVAFSPDGSHLASASSDGTVRMWNPRNPHLSTVVLDERIKELRGVAEAHKKKLVDLTAFVGSNADVLRAIDGIEKGQSSFFAAAFSPDLTRLASISMDGRTVFLWDLRQRGAPPVLLEGSQSARKISFVGFSPDGTRVASAGEDPNVQVWDLRTPGNPPVTYKQQGTTSSALAFSPDSSRLAFESRGNPNVRNVHLWDLRNSAEPPVLLPGQPPPALVSPGQQLPVSDSLAFSPDGSKLASLERVTGRVRLWNLGSGAADYLCTRVLRNLSMDEWRLYVGENIPYERTCPALPPGT